MYLTLLISFYWISEFLLFNYYVRNIEYRDKTVQFIAVVKTKGKHK